MRTIKFRGQSIGGHYVHGLLTKKKIRNNGNVCWAIAAGDGLRSADVVPVNEESIAQLIAVDSNGREVYEGDSVIRICDSDGKPVECFPMRATFDDYFAINNGEIVLCEEGES